MDALGMVRGLVTIPPTICGLSGSSPGSRGFPLSETSAAVERPIAREELICMEGDYYRQANAGNAEQRP